MTPKRQLVILIVILAVGAMIRGSYLAEVVHHPDFDRPGLDAGYHDYWARALITGNWKPPYGNADPLIRTTPFFRPPGYPYFLAFVYLITGSSYFWSRMFQMLLGLASCVLGFLLGRRMFGAGVGLVFAALMSVYWAFVYFETEFMEPVLLVLLVLGMMCALSLWTERLTWPRGVSAGALLGLCALVRPNVLIFLPVVLVWAYWSLAGRKERRAFTIAATGFLVGAAMMIAPVTVRNYVVSREPVLISSNAGVNLYLGNNPYADGLNPASPLFPRWSCFDYASIVARLERTLGREITYSQASAYYAGEAMRYVRENPGATLKLTWKKALLFWGPKEVSNEKQDEFERTHSRVLRNMPGGFSFALAMGILGFALLACDVRRRTGRLRFKGDGQVSMSILIALFIVTYFASYLPFFVAGRYRIPIVPFLLLFAAYAIASLVCSLLDRRWLRGALLVVVWLGLLGLTSRNFAGYQPNLARWHFDRAVCHDLQNRVKQAEKEYRRAIRVRPNYADARCGLGVLLGKQGRVGGAIREFRETIRIRPHSSEAHYNLGVAYAAQGKLDEAVAELREATRYAPDDLPTRHVLGNLLGEMGRLSEAAEQFRVIVRLAPDDFTGHYNLGTALAGLGKRREAIAHFQKSVQLRPDYAKAHKSLAVALYGEGRYAEAWRHVLLCEKYGGKPHPAFIKMLSARMPRPG